MVYKARQDIKNLHLEICIHGFMREWSELPELLAHLSTISRLSMLLSVAALVVNPI